MIIWIIGLSGSGKTTLATETVRLMRQTGKPVALLDGDAVREAFDNDLGHTLEDRRRNAERLCRLSRFLDSQGINAVCAVLSIFEESREWNRTHIRNYHEVFIDAPLDILVARDSKGLYRRAMQGEIADFPGVSLPFPVPVRPDLVIANNGDITQLVAYAPSLANLAG